MHSKNLLKDGSLTSFKSSKGRLGFARLWVYMCLTFRFLLPRDNAFDQLIFPQKTQMMTEGLEVGKAIRRNQESPSLKKSYRPSLHIYSA